MPSPPSTAMWKALLADMGLPRDGRKDRHCERSEAIHSDVCGGVDCFVASLLAMTDWLRRQHRAADQLAFLQVEQRVVGLCERQPRHRDRRNLLAAHEIEQLLRFAKIADIAAL